MAVAPDALVLSGGNDINEYSLRDRTEFALLNWAQARQLPVLGICRGMQLMATWAGTTLISIAGHVDTRHELNFIGNQDGLVAGIPREVNSYHNHAVRDCPEGFYVLAESADAVIEAIAHRQLNWQACMWHPEREPAFNLVDINRIRKLFGITS
ncbi:glutamine amidotransferase class-I [Oleiphilus messinensis]|uniref:Glutamine amidotransferase class-I n=2 Tax=Oleiphilus messinensis TaxID=141451 RepID=A0A1Y0IAH7_9GAMM|nr:glutamine amidotransferase class-I [Oleiphilus messinensis]